VPGTGGRGGRERLAVLAPVGLLVAVSCVQITLAQTAFLSPWKGGGFGMFASLDGLGFRHVRLYVDAPGRSEELALPESLADTAARLAVFPTGRALEVLGAGVLARERRLGRPATVARVEVWRTRFSASLESTEERIAAGTVGDDGRVERARR
jgi:hypothetical protein